MIHGFKNSPLACEGIIGDGCGGGRWFFVEDETLKVYDPQTKEVMNLLTDIKDAKEVSKKGCIITIKCEKELVKFDLSSMGRTVQ